jgi:hypothetical protein
VCVIALGPPVLALHAQTNQPANWVNNSFNPNPNFGVVNAQSANPSFTNNGVHLGTLYGDSAIGATLRLEKPSDTITFSGQVAFTGDVNPDGNVQFRVGLYSRGDSQSDTNWLGYMIGNPVNVGPDGPKGLFIRNNPNPGIYGSGLEDTATRPKVDQVSCTPAWAAGTYDFSLSVTQLAEGTQRVTWNLAGQPPGTYSFTGIYTNTVLATAPTTFDRVGFLGGAALFRSASASTSIDFRQLSVTLTPAGKDGH